MVDGGIHYWPFQFGLTPCRRFWGHNRKTVVNHLNFDVKTQSKIIHACLSSMHCWRSLHPSVRVCRVRVRAGQRKHNESCESLWRSGMKYPKTSHLRLQSITCTELAGLAQYSLKKFLFGRWNWSALINWSSLTKKEIFSGFFKSYKCFS